MWIQAVVLLLVWVAYAISQTRGGRPQGNWATSASRTKCALFATALFAVPGIGLGGWLLLLYSWHAFGNSGLAWWAWVGTALLGLAYVHCQVVATGLLVSLARPEVTSERARTSEDGNP